MLPPESHESPTESMATRAVTQAKAVLVQPDLVWRNMDIESTSDLTLGMKLTVKRAHLFISTVLSSRVQMMGMGWGACT